MYVTVADFAVDEDETVMKGKSTIVVTTFIRLQVRFVDAKTGQIYIIGKDGNVKKKTFKKKWLSPNDEKNSSEMQHIARTPESEEILKQDKQDVPKQKRVKKNKDSDPLSITTGKSKSRKKKKNN